MKSSADNGGNWRAFFKLGYLNLRLLQLNAQLIALRLQRRNLLFKVAYFKVCNRRLVLREEHPFLKDLDRTPLVNPPVDPVNKVKVHATDSKPGWPYHNSKNRGVQ